MVTPLPRQNDPLAMIRAFTQPRRNQLAGLASGLLSANDWGPGLSAGFAQAAQGRQVDDAYAETQKAEAERQRQLQETIGYLRQQPGGEPWAARVESGLLDGKEAFQSWYAESKPKEPKYQEVGGKLVKIDGDNITEAFDPFEGTGGVDPKEAFNREKDLTGQYTGADPIKTYTTVRDSYERVRESASQNTGAGDMGLIYGYMKMLDPGSVVRESEFAMAAQAGSFGEQIQGLVSRLVNGERLPDTVRKQFVDNADKLYEQAASNASEINDQFSTRASEWGVDPSRFIRPVEKYDPLNLGGPAAGGLDPEIDSLVKKYGF